MGLLDDIVARKRVAIAERRAALPARDLVAALTPAGSERVRLLAELKRASPVAGVLAQGFDPIPRAPEYVEAGAAALSVLTDPHFQGGLGDLAAVRVAVACPILQKDFVV